MPSVYGNCDAQYNRSYTDGMKTAVSLPDEIFRQAEAVAKRMRVSRSQLYTTAISEYLDKHRADWITRRLNEVYSKHDSKLDPALERLMLKSLAKNR
jgi:metal-responsive CopG/Arc/MetJ family transcriptional regulator